MPGYAASSMRQMLPSGKVKVIAPAAFTEAAVGENIIAGNAMSRRASYMYGNLIPKVATGQVDGGLGKTTSTGTTGLILPTDHVTRTGESITLDGVELQIIMAPESEAPAEFMFYMPKYKAFCTAENATHTLHNLYTLRGAKVRDGLLWSKYLQASLDMFGDDMQVVFASHHWPTWGNGRAVTYLKSAARRVRFIHDQTMRMANSGMTPQEIGDAMRLPGALAATWACRSYYGSVYHDTVAQYNLRLGFFDGVPATLHQHQPTEAGKRYVKFMGGADNVLRQAKDSFDQGDYRWVAEVVNHVVFADGDNTAARQLLADAYEQLGYQSESGPWRNFYLTGALELRRGIAKLPVPDTASPDTIRAMPIEMFFDYLGVRLNADRAAGKNVDFNLELTDTGDIFILGVGNSAIHYSKGRKHPNPDASVIMSRTDLNDVMLGTANMEKQIIAGKAKLTGDPQKLAQFVSWLDTFEFWFPDRNGPDRTHRRCAPSADLRIEFSVDHPMTLNVAVATRQAIDDGVLLQADALDGPALRLDAIGSLKAVQRRLEAVLSPPELNALPDFFMLMIESRTWAFFRATDSGFDPNCSPELPRVAAEIEFDRDAAIVTAETVMRQILLGRLSFAQAVRDGLIVVDADRGRGAALVDAWSASFPDQGFSRFLCTSWTSPVASLVA